MGLNPATEEGLLLLVSTPELVAAPGVASTCFAYRDLKGFGVKNASMFSFGISSRKVCGRKEKKEKKARKNNAKFSGHYVRPRTHNVRTNNAKFSGHYVI